MDIVERICFPGHKHNEDLIGSSAKCAWVLDGTKGEMPEHYLHDVSDAIWYVEKWQHYLKENADNTERTLKEIVSEGLHTIKTAFLTLSGERDVALQSFPYASITIVRDLGDKIEYFILGNSVMLSFDKFSGATCHKSVNTIHAPSHYHSHFLCFDEDSTNYALHGHIEVSTIEGLFLATRGISRAFTDYAFLSIEELYAFLNDKNLLDFYRTLRHTEKEKNTVSEDASALFIRT